MDRTSDSNCGWENNRDIDRDKDRSKDKNRDSD